MGQGQGCEGAEDGGGVTPHLFVITTNTKDYGPRFVVREWVGITASAVPLAVVGSLEEARGAVEEACPSLVRMARIPEDDVVIVESWGPAEYVARLLAMEPYV